MKNLTEYNDFKSIKKDSVEPIVEGAQLFDKNTWKVRTRIEIPTTLINAYFKKVQAETGDDVKSRWSEQEIAEEFVKYISTAFVNVENLPSSIVTSMDKKPQVQTQEDMPEDADIQSQVQEPDVQVEEAPQGQQIQNDAQNIQQTQPQSQEPVQTQSQAPAQEI